MKRVLQSALLLCFLSSAAPIGSASNAEALEDTVDYLVEFVRTSDVVFIRNEKEHTPEDAASHMLKKYKYAKRKVKTPEDFIEYCATRSTMSGKPYRVRLGDGSTITSAAWLLTELEEYRKRVRESGAGAGLSYEIREFRMQYGTCVTPQEDCASVVIRYPEFAGEVEDTFLAVISRAIGRRLTTPVYEGTAPGSYEDLADSFIDGYKRTQSDFPDYKWGWTLEREASVVYSCDSFVCIAIGEISFTGGAHPNSRKDFANFDFSDGSRIGLGDVLIGGYEENLTEAAERVFREVRGIEPGESLEEAGFMFEGGVFSLNDNFGITGEGLVFRFNDYEIAPHSMGPTEITVTYDGIASLIRTDGLLKGVVE